VHILIADASPAISLKFWLLVAELPQVVIQGIGNQLMPRFVPVAIVGDKVLDAVFVILGGGVAKKHAVQIDEGQLALGAKFFP